MHSENVKVDCVIIISQNPILVISKSIVPETIDAFGECKGRSCDFIITSQNPVWVISLRVFTTFHGLVLDGLYIRHLL